jgi:hypothetical protein
VSLAKRVNKGAVFLAGLGMLVGLPAVIVAASYRTIARRAGTVVDDLAPYGSELRALEPYQPSPADPDPHGRTAYSGPGWYVRSAPDGSHRAVTTSWGGLIGEVLVGLVSDRAFYHTVAVWDERARSLREVVSIKEADPHSGIAHRYAWSRDSQALLIHGAGRLPEDYKRVVDICLVYLPRSDKLYRLAHCPPHGENPPGAAR